MWMLARNSALVIAALLALSGPAFAHAHLKSAMPPVNGKVSASPSEVVLHFTEGVNLRFTGLTIKGFNGSQVATGKSKLKPGDDQTLMVTLPESLKPGQYRVSWHALSKDGHKTHGTYHLTVTSK